MIIAIGKPSDVGGDMGRAVDVEKLQSALTGIYEAALEPDLWEATVNRIADMIGAESTHLLAMERATGRTGIGILTRQNPDAHREYLEDYMEQDIRIPRLLRSMTGRIIRNDDVWTEEERQQSPVYQEYQRKHGLYEITGSQLGIEGHMTWAGFSRSTEDPFSEEELRLIEILMPHFRQALRLGIALQQEKQQKDALGELWSNDGRGIILLTSRGNLIYANREAESMQTSGLFRLNGKSLHFKDAALNGVLAANLANLSEGKMAVAVPTGITSTAEGMQMGIRFIGCPGNEADTGCRAEGGSCLMVMVVPFTSEPAASEDEIDQFGMLFALTDAEKKVVGSIASGEDLVAHAKLRGIALDSARKYLKSVLSKTGCRSQKDLIRMVERFCFLRLR